MFEGIFSEKEIKERLSELKEIDEDMYESLLSKIEFNRFQRLKKTTKQIIRRYLARSQKGTIKEYPARFIEEYKKRISVRELIDCINRPSHKKKILYITSPPDFNLVNQSIYLRKAGYETILLMEIPWLINFVEKYFDTVYVFNSIYTMCYILKEANPYLIHVQGNTCTSNHFGILAKLLSKCKIAFNFYDIPSTTILEEDIKLLGGEKKDVELDFFSERFASERCNGLIVGYSSGAVEILKSRYHINTPILEFHSYACDEFISSDNSKYSDLDHNIHIVYGGNVAPSYLPEKFHGDVQFHSLIEKLTKQGIYFDIYISPYISPLRIKQIFGDYMLLSEKNRFFKFKKGFPRNEATRKFSKYDFGAMIYLYDRGTCMEEHNRTRLPDKFFTYLEAGLPLLISEEAEYPAKLVKDYEIGIVVSQKDLDNLPEVINSYDREKLRANVKKAREELSMKKHIGRLIDFYDQIVENK
jgi:glycosyltransferase involved in cell wall biosynthesis